jgi:hypothetical protein
VRAVRHASQSPRLSLEELSVIVRSLANWTTSGRPIDRCSLATEIDIVIGLVSELYPDPATAVQIEAARSLLAEGQPPAALVKVEAILIRQR